MRSKLPAVVLIGTLMSFPCALAQTEVETETDGPEVITELRHEIAELKQRIAELENKLARLEAIENRLLRNEQRMRRMDGWERIPGTYLRFPEGVERAMMGDAAAFPKKWEGRNELQPPSIELRPDAFQGDPLPRFELPQDE